MTVPVGIFPGAPSAFAFDRDEGQVRWDGIAGLVINGTIFSGTPGPVTAVTGILVCNPGDDTQACIAPGFLDTRGDINIAPPSSIVDPDATGRSRFIGHAAIAAARAATGV